MHHTQAPSASDANGAHHEDDRYSILFAAALTFSTACHPRRRMPSFSISRP